jgi:hypothetical protein
MEIANLQLMSHLYPRTHLPSQSCAFQVRCLALSSIIERMRDEGNVALAACDGSSHLVY